MNLLVLGVDGASFNLIHNWIQTGGTWTDLGPHISANGYNGIIDACCNNPLGGRNAWVNDLMSWTEVQVDLSSFAGEAVHIRWRIGSMRQPGKSGCRSIAG